MKRFYGVRKGRVIGIFTDYDRVQDSVSGYSGAEYKGFSSRKEAEEYLGLTDIEDIIDVIEYLPEEIYIASNDETLIAYVDGSYNKEISTEIYGAGIVLIHPNNKQDHVSLKGTEGAELNNVAGELSATMYAMKQAKDQGYGNLVIYYDYAGIENWINGSWATKNKYTKKYFEYYNKNIKPFINVEFKKVKSHSKLMYNDLADLLAKRALIN